MSTIRHAFVSAQADNVARSWLVQPSNWNAALVCDDAHLNMVLGSNAAPSLAGGATENLALGGHAGESLVSGSGNVLLGTYAGQSLTTHTYNVLVGFRAGRFTTANQDTFVGGGAGALNETGTNNAFFGYNTGAANVAGAEDTFLGANAGGSNTSGSGNTFVGKNASHLSTTSTNCSVLGAAAALSAVDSEYETVIGAEATGHGDNTITLGRTNDAVWAPGGEIVVGLSAQQGVLRWTPYDSNAGPFRIDVAPNAAYLGFNLDTETWTRINSADKALVLGLERDYDDPIVGHRTMEFYLQYMPDDGFDAVGGIRPFFIGIDKTTDLPTGAVLCGGTTLELNLNDGTGTDGEKSLGKRKLLIQPTLATFQLALIATSFKANSGNNPSTGLFGMPNGQNFMARNAANTGDIGVFTVPSDDHLYLGFGNVNDVVLKPSNVEAVRFTSTGMTMADAKDITINGTTGTKIGQSSSKIGVFGVTPIVRPVLATGAGATADNIITVLQNLGWVKQS